MKKSLALMLCAVLVLSLLAGCGGGSGEPAQTTEMTEYVPRDTPDTKLHEPAADFAGGSGTEADPYQISDASHLVLLSQKLEEESEVGNWDETYTTAYYILTADISLNDTADFENWADSAPAYGWEPIGKGTGFGFGGVFDGNGHTISGMYINADANLDSYSQKNYGLFAKVEGTIRNLTIDQSYICVSGGVKNVGAVVGSTVLDEARIENCVSNAVIEIYDDGNAGGIVGDGSDSTITGCQFGGTISQLDDQWSHLGGICGYGGKISSCTNLGRISGSGYSGGIVGYGGNVTDSVNKGTVSGDTVGGISGRVYAAGTNQEIENPQKTIENCTNEGQVTGISLAGGIVGWMGNDESDISMSVINCENNGQVSCDESAAGIIGKLSVERTNILNVENCVNYADISGAGKVGGIVCELAGAVLHQEGDVVISGCKNLGNITSEDQYSAGIITYLLIMGDETDMRLSVENCTNEGDIQSVQYAGGILGFSNVGFNSVVEDLNISDDTKVILSGCSNAGDVTVTTSNAMAGGVVGVLGLGHISTNITDCINTGAVSVDFTLTDAEIEELQGVDWPEIYQISGGIVGRIGDALKLTTAEGVETNANNVNAAEGNIVISGCRNTGTISAPDYSFILNKWEQPLYVNYLGGIVGQCGATDGYAFRVENCTYTGADRGLGNEEYPDVGQKK